MFSRQHVRSTLLSALAVLMLLVTSVSASGASATRAATSSIARAASVSTSTSATPGIQQGTGPSTAGAASPAATPTCKLITSFNANNFPSSPKLDNPLYPLAPGMQFILQGVANDGSGLQPHQVILIVTDLTKVIHGVRTVVLWDRDFNTGVLKESELAFHAQDKAGNIWNLGEYPAQYVNGQFTDAPDTWIEGLAGAQGGTVIPGNPKVGTPKFLQAYAPDPQSGQPPIIQDCGQVSAVGQHFCNIIGCYDNVLVVDETSPPELGTQQKYYAPGVGNFNIGAINNDPQGETLVLSETLHLGREDCLAARQAALALEDQAYHDTSQNVYGLTTPMEQTEQTGYCESLPPSTPTPTPPSAPNPNIYLPIAAKSSAAPPPALYDGCKSTPDPASAPNYPVRIVTVDKVAEVVTLENVSTTIVSLEDWNMCSLYIHKDHDQIFGTIAPGQQRSFKNIGGYGPVWDDNHRNDGALYNAAGVLVSYWIDQ